MDDAPNPDPTSDPPRAPVPTREPVLASSPNVAPPSDPCLLVIFGATGDLAHRKLIPAIFELARTGRLRPSFRLLGAARDGLDDAAFRARVRERLQELGLAADRADAWCEEHLHYQPMPDDEPATFAALRERIEGIEREGGLPGNRVFHLALPPAAFPVIATALGDAGLSGSPGWTRLVIEKPFGTDLASARGLNAVLHRHFGEEQIYRIDHYLGKETVQNLLAFRFANPLFETSWNRDRVERVEITVSESLGVGRRAGYYDRAGALRDMVQNHLTQLLCFVAMEVPSAFEADAIRVEKVKVLRSARRLTPDDVVFGQYVAGRTPSGDVRGYRGEEGVPADSITPTFAGVRIELDSWRWKGVPFLLRTGKAMPRKLTEVAVVFRRPPTAIFRRDERPDAGQDVLRITLQPDEGFHLGFDVKQPGEEMRLVKQELGFAYADVFGDLQDAYTTLLRDVFQGDQTLFVHGDEVEASWSLYEPVLDLDVEPDFYPAGSWGPTEMRRLLPSRDWVSCGESVAHGRIHATPPRLRPGLRPGAEERETVGEAEEEGVGAER